MCNTLEGSKTIQNDLDAPREIAVNPVYAQQDQVNGHQAKQFPPIRICLKQCLREGSDQASPSLAHSITNAVEQRFGYNLQINEPSVTATSVLS
jgi:hypothetical protein